VNQSLLLHLAQDSAGELVGGGVAAHVACAGLAIVRLVLSGSGLEWTGNLPVGDDLVDRLRDAVGVVIKTNVAQHHRGGQEQRSGVSLVFALDVETDVTASGLEESDVAAHVASGNDTGSTDESGTNVGENASVQVGHDHDVELLRPRDTLHGGVVDNHVVGLESGVVLADALDGVAEQTIGELHDVGLVDAGDLLAVIGERKGKGELGDALRLLAGNDLERLDDAADRLVLEARVLALGVLADDAEVDVLVACLVAGDVLDQDDGGVDVELLAESDVEGAVAGSLNGRVQDALETELVALERSNRLAEELLRVDVACLDTGDVDLLPLNGHVVRLEDLLDRLGDLGTNSVTCAMFNIRRSVRRLSRRTRNERHGVFAAELGGLEDVLVDRGHCCIPLEAVQSRDTWWAYFARPWMGRIEQASRPAGASVWAVSARQFCAWSPHCGHMGCIVPAPFVERSSTAS
jgi:hypothetical protein